MSRNRVNDARALRETDADSKHTDRAPVRGRRFALFGHEISDPLVGNSLGHIGRLLM